MKQSEAWLAQSKSDWMTSKRVLSEDDGTTFCQSIAKSQQTVEKAVKALVAALGEASIATMTIGFGHGVEKFAQTFQCLSKKQPTSAEKDIVSSIRAEFSDTDISSGIRFLDSIVPKAPAPGESAKRNTEYPFHANDGSFRAPAEPDVFTLQDVRRCLAVAERVHIKCHKFTNALKRI